MKECIITFLIALLASCLLTSCWTFFGFLPAYQPYPWPTGIDGIKEASSGFGLKREDMLYPEIHFTDKSRTSLYMTKISESSNERNIDFPLGANN